MGSSTGGGCKRKQVLIGEKFYIQVIHVCVIYMIKS